MAAKGERVSRQLITEYRSELDRIHAASGSKRESVVREAFKDLLKRCGKSRDLIFLAEHEYLTPTGDRRYIDGALVHSIRVPFGYWEAKDTNDDLDEEIRKKTAIGYPRDNIIYDDTDTAVLIQNKREVGRAKMEDTEALFHLLELFFAFERQEIADFRKAVRQFAADLPAVLKRLREIVAEKRAQSRDFARAELKFLDHAREAINPAVTEEDVQEMLIQHVLTEDIFAKVFDNPEFHRKNNVAAALYELEEKLFGYGEKSKLLAALRPYYVGIESTASVIESHSEKQLFLKGLYENFYKVYNPLAADRLGVVYTPGEIVRFMIRSADWLCHKHFGKGLDDRGVEILDPATGTGTFIVELLEHFRGNREKLAYKYKEELHANEVAILPYYVANLNIEATYHAITGQFAEFPGLVFVDTLDNVDALGIYSGHQHDLLGAIADENAERIKRQNRRKISVIIGNPPYNANQQNENQNNKNRAYSRVDERIKQTYIKASTAQKTKLYDMYVRFFRWASDRLSDDGVVAFITNRSFIDASMADGFRRKVVQEFAEGWIIDLGGDYKKQGAAGSGNVFGIGTGVAVSFWVKRKTANESASVRYVAAPSGTAEDKLSWISELRTENHAWLQIGHRTDAAWIDIPDATTEGMLPLVDKASKLKEGRAQDRAIFKLFSLGVATNRDEWVYDSDALSLAKKIKYFIATFNSEHRRWRREGQPRATGDWVDRSIKWTSELEAHLRQPQPLRSRRAFKRRALYRPFNKTFTHFAPVISHRPYQMHRFFPFGTSEPNAYLAMTGPGSQKPWMSLASDVLPDLHLVGAGAGTNVTPRYRYTKSGERVDNITDWALNKFKAHYGKQFPGEGRGTARTKTGAEAPLGPRPSPGSRAKDAIFAYCYAVLHDPVYREKYALNLKREFPRIPFYDDFAKWAGWGERLLDLHIGYEQATPFKFTRIDTPNPKRTKESHPKPKLKSDPEKGLVIVDEDTQLTGIPREAWDYRLGNRSAIDWVLDQHKEKTPRDPTVREKFNTYRFADYKESMIDLLARVITVSLETVKITNAMRQLGPDGEETRQ
jgi:predicted helicase